MFCQVNTQIVLLPCHFFSFFFLSLSSRNSGNHNILGFFLELLPEALYQLWRETLSLLRSQVNWSCNLKSLPVKDSAQIRVVREHFPDINLTFTRATAQALTRVRKFFQIHSVQRSPQLAYVCLKYGRTCIDNCHGALDCKDFHHFPDFRPCWILLVSSCQ